MCKAFSCIVTKDKKVYWKAGMDGHADQIRHFKLEKLEERGHTAKVEIIPPKGDYLNLNSRWALKVDEKTQPDWFSPAHGKACRKELGLWKKEVYSSFNWREAKSPIHPFKIKPPRRITQEHLRLLKEWESVRGSVRESVRGSVRESVGGAVWESVWGSVRESVGGSVRESVGGSVGESVWDDLVWGSVYAYIGSLFPNIQKWKYVDCEKLKIREGQYPFEPAVKLWRLGLVPATGGKLWYLLARDKTYKKCKVVWKGEL